jgi:hypothetical protein
VLVVGEQIVDLKAERRADRRQKQPTTSLRPL